MQNAKLIQTGPLSFDSGLSQSGPLHSSCVVFQGAAVLIVGNSGSGKSSLALELMQCGATLVSDDQTLLEARNNRVYASAPDPLRGLIEARGVGILNAPYAGPSEVKFVASLDRDETKRLPPQYTYSILGVALPLLFNVPYPHFRSAILQYLAHGRSD